MTIIRNEDYIASRRRIGTIASFVGLGILLGSMALNFLNRDNASYIMLSLMGLFLGFASSQIGLYFANRFVRSPRPDEQIDKGAGKIKGLRLYHYIMPVPHVILSRAGIITIVSKYQSGNITADGYKWTQTKIGILRRLFGQETLGNPSAEAEYQIKQIAKFIGQNVPELADQELPIAAIIVFTTPNAGELDLRKSTVPAMYYTKLKGFLKQRNQETNMSEETYTLLRNAFDAAAADVLDDEDEDNDA